MKNILIDRAAIQGQLERFADCRITLNELRQWLTPLLVGIQVPATVDRDLVFRLAYLFEDESQSEAAHLRNAERLVAAMTDVETNAALLELISLITDQDRLCGIVDKYRAKVISRTGFLSVISNARYSRGVKQWLGSSDDIALEHLCELLANGRYSSAAATLQLQ